jgi:hypothetical protein
MKSYILLLISGVLLMANVFSQDAGTLFVKISKSEFRTRDKEGFDQAWANLKQANVLFQEGTGTFGLARDFYLLAHQYNENNAELNYLIGVCYLFTDEKKEALRYLMRSYEKKPKLSPEIRYLMGRAYHYSLDFDKAISEYNAFMNSLPESDKAARGPVVTKLVQECTDGKKIVENRKRVIITNLGDSINSVYDDYFSIFSNNDSILYFTSRRFSGRKPKRNPYDNKFYEDIYRSHLKDGKWTMALPMPKPVNGKGNESAVGISQDGSLLYLYKGNVNGGDVFLSSRKNNKWQSPENLSPRLMSDQAETSVCFTAGGDTMYYISGDKEISLGGRDIFRSVKDEKGKWGKPENLSAIINTAYDEESIYLSRDGKELYFSSRGHNTMGGYDIFRSSLNSDGSWTEPENLGYPVNSPDEDLFFTQSSNGKYGYYTTIREGGIGEKDIYKIAFLGSEKEFILDGTEMWIAGQPDTLKKGFFSIPAAIQLDSSWYITGKVMDKKTLAPLNARLEIIHIDSAKIIATSYSADSGMYRLKVGSAAKYRVLIMTGDYMFLVDTFDISGTNPDVPFVRDFYLQKIEVGIKVVLENIYFQTGKAVLTAASFPTLNKVIEFMKSNESMRLEISGHTDNVGSLKANNKLSEDRAKSVVDYLVANGIDKGRLVSKGYGYSQPVAPNSTPDGREKNRRIEFKIINN